MATLFWNVEFGLLGQFNWYSPVTVTLLIFSVVLLNLWFVCWLCFRIIPNNFVGVVEKLWSVSGSVPERQIISPNGEAGFQAELLRVAVVG